MLVGSPRRIIMRCIGNTMDLPSYGDVLGQFLLISTINFTHWCGVSSTT